MMNTKMLETLLQKSWSKETCYPNNKKNWTDKNPAIGQCAITALIVQDYFGGELLYCKHHNHYWNRLPDGKEIDLTRSQFTKNTSVCLDDIIPREYILEIGSTKKENTLQRYILLRHRIKKSHE